MTAGAAHRAARTALPSRAALPTQTVAAMLLAASIGELLILRIGTRTAIHIPDIEAVYRPFRIVAATGRFAFSVAVVLLACLLVRLAVDLYRSGATLIAGGVAGFVCAATLGRLGLVTADIVGVITLAVVIVAAATGCRRAGIAAASAIALFAVAYTVAALPSLLSVGSAATLSDLVLWSERLVVLAAIVSGPALRHALGAPLIPSRRLAWSAGLVGVVVAAAIMANPSTTHILMLWNFGLTGTLPALAYGLATASVAVAVGSALLHRVPLTAFGLALVSLGGLGLISSYQSGLTIAGLALIAFESGRMASRPSPHIEFHRARRPSSALRGLRTAFPKQPPSPQTQ